MTTFHYLLNMVRQNCRGYQEIYHCHPSIADFQLGTAGGNRRALNHHKLLTEVEKTVRAQPFGLAIFGTTAHKAIRPEQHTTRDWVEGFKNLPLCGDFTC